MPPAASRRFPRFVEGCPRFGGDVSRPVGGVPRFVGVLRFVGGVLLAWALVAPAHAQVTLFADDFDTGGSAAEWTLFSHAGDYTADFAFDYSTRGIPPAPHSMGTTVGLRAAVNNNDAVPATDAVSAFPTGQTFAGDITLRFDLWLNYNGGAGGGTGSTEFATAGLNHSATRVNWAGSPSSDGFWFAVSGEGGDTDDYRAYRGGALLPLTESAYAAASRNHTAAFYQALFPSPTYETQGAPGKHWVEVEIRQRKGVIEWRLNGMLVAIRLDTSLDQGAIMLGYMDTFTSIANPAADNFVLFDNVRVTAPDCDGNGIADRQDLIDGAASGADCNGNGLLDVCETVAAGDADADGDVDAADLSAFAACMAGPGAAPEPPDSACVAACLAAFDLAAGGDVDLEDFWALQPLATVGPFPPRPAGAPTGSPFLAEVAPLARTAREARVVEEVTGGNVPGFIRGFAPINVSANIGGAPTSATYYVTPDYVCIGVDADFVRMPMTPLIAQPIADALGCLLPTRKMVNDTWAQAAIKLAPAPISPTTVDITLATTFFRHHERIEAQRAGQALGPLIGGIKKDVVITPLLASNPNRVAIYGWHQLNGVPIQPLYLGHVDFYADYSHGIRLVCDRMRVNGVETPVAQVLDDPDLHVLLSDEGVVPNPRY